MDLKTIIYQIIKINNMESNELLASLAKMEASLKEIESARMQVESTVKASSGLQKEVGEYVSAVRKLCVTLHAWEEELKTREISLRHETESVISDIKRLCEESITSFSSNINEIGTSFKNNTKDVLERFTEQNNKLAGRVEELNALGEQIKNTTEEIENVKGSIEVISKDLKNSQDEQDRVLDEIIQKIAAFPAMIQQSTITITQAVSSSKQSLNEVLAQTNKTLDTVNGKTENLALNIANLSSLCQNINSSVSSATDNLSSALNKAKEEITSELVIVKADITKGTNINRWLIIVGFILLLLLQFLL